MNPLKLNLPPVRRKGDPVYASDTNLIVEALRQIEARLTSATVASSPDIAAKTGPIGTLLSLTRKRGWPDTLPPLWPTLIMRGPVEDRSYFVTVERGIVADSLLGGSEGTQMREKIEPSNLLGEDGKPTEFEMSIGDFIYVTYSTDSTTGAVMTDEGDEPRIVVSSTDEKTLRHKPPVGDETDGERGVTWHKLAQLVDDDAGVRLIMWEAGDNPQNFPLSRFKKAGGNADVFKEYDLENARYATRGITGENGITVTQEEDQIKIELGDGETDLNIIAYGLEVSYDGGYVNGIGISTSEHWVIAIRGGLVVGHYDTLAAMEADLGVEGGIASRTVLDGTVGGT
jgi:hypothetical protein